MEPADQPAYDAPAEPDKMVAADSPPKKEPAMDIHPPHGAIHTKKDFFIHLLTIILGILIALSLDAMLHWMEHRSLVREARRNLAAEIRHNHNELNNTLLGLRKSEEQVKQIVTVIKELKSQQRPDVSPMSVGMDGASLYSTSWNAANRSGAIGYMSYAEVERYSALYDQQQLYLNLQDRAISPLLELFGLLKMKGADLKRLPTRDLEEIERTAHQLLSREEILESNGKSLSDEYAKFESAGK
jgi:hypothetical protein